MRKLLVILLIAAVLIAFPVSAAKTDDNTKAGGNNTAAVSGAVNGTAKGIDDKLTGTDKAANQSGGSATAQANRNISAGQGNGVSTNLTSALQNQQEIKAQIKLIQKEAANQSGLSSDNRLKNQNTVRVAVKTLLAAGNISGGIGDQISVIAREFNNSVKVQYTAEETIQNRNSLARFFFGGDSEAAEEIQQQIEQNRIRLANLNDLMNMCGEDCDEELKAMIQEQIQLLEQEQNRLQELSQAELEDKGLLGGLFG